MSQLEVHTSPGTPRSGTEPSLPELTARAIVIGLVLAVVMGAANVYLGLKAGLTVSASIPAAVMGSLVLRALGRRQGSSLLEANQVQTAASAGESLAAGIIFTVPALLLIGYWEEFEMWTTTLIAFTGGLLGILFMIPMRRVFVEGSPDLPYPEAVACAAVLETSDADRQSAAASGAGSIVAGGGVGALLKLLTSGLGWVQGSMEGALATSAGRVFFLGADVSAALIAVGFIVRLNVALLVGLGGVIGWLVCMPLWPEIRGLLALPPLEIEATSAVDRAFALWSTQIRYVGVGAMAVGGLTSLWRVRAGLAHALEELQRGIRGRTETEAPRQDGDLSAIAILLLGGLAVLGVVVVYWHFTGDVGVTLLASALMITLSFFFVAVASYIVGLVGNSNSPVSGMTITAVLVTGGFVAIAGYSGTQGMVATLGVAAIVCCAACTSGDVCNDLKTGSIVGASPRRQQVMQILAVAVASLVMAPVLQLLQDVYGIGSRELSAPQAGLFASLAEGFFGSGTIPWALVTLGAGLGVALLALDRVLGAASSSFRIHLMPVAVGIYLPFGLAIPITLGGVLAHLHERRARPEERDSVLRRGILFSSGVIAGEALMGVGIAIAVTALASSGSAEEDAVSSALLSPGTATFLAAAAVLVTFWLGTRPGSERR